jgi:hypothetical protein
LSVFSPSTVALPCRRDVQAWIALEIAAALRGCDVHVIGELLHGWRAAEVLFELAHREPHVADLLHQVARDVNHLLRVLDRRGGWPGRSSSRRRC